jgi:hypothetical protein
MPIGMPHAPGIGRRRFLAGAASAGVAGLAPAGGEAGPAAGENPQGVADTPSYRTAAIQAARWIRSAESKDMAGFWQPEPDHPEIKATVSLPNGFYTGSAGLVLFFIELAQATGDKSYWDDARRGGDYLVHSWRETASAPPRLASSQ